MEDSKTDIMTPDMKLLAQTHTHLIHMLPGVSVNLSWSVSHYNQFNRIVSSSNTQMMIAYFT